MNYSCGSSVGTLESISINIPKDGLLLLKSWQTICEGEEVSSVPNFFAVNVWESRDVTLYILWHGAG